LKKFMLLMVAALLVSLLVIAGCAQPAAPSETTKTVTSTVTAGAGATATVTAPAKTVTVAAAAEEPEVFEWTMAAMMADSPLLGHFDGPFSDYNYMMHSLSDRGFADWITEMTGGRLKVTIVEPNSIFPTSETVENIGQGVIEIAHIAQGWLGGSVPAATVASGLPMAWPTAAIAFDCYQNYGFEEIMDEAYAERNLWAEYIPTDEIMGFITTFDASSPESIKGKKIRVWGAYGKLVEAMGGNPVAMAYADVYMGLKLGTVDGSTTGALALENAALKEVAMGMTTYPKTNTPVNAIVINMDAFNSLPDDIKAILDIEVKHFELAMASVEGIQNQLVVANTIKESGIKTWQWTAEDVAMLMELARNEVWPGYAEQSARSAECVDVMIEHMQILGLLD